MWELGPQHIPVMSCCGRHMVVLIFSMKGKTSLQDHQVGPSQSKCALYHVSELQEANGEAQLHGQFCQGNTSQTEPCSHLPTAPGPPPAPVSRAGPQPDLQAGQAQRGGTQALNPQAQNRARRAPPSTWWDSALCCSCEISLQALEGTSKIRLSIFLLQSFNDSASLGWQELRACASPLTSDRALAGEGKLHYGLMLSIQSPIF